MANIKIETLSGRLTSLGYTSAANLLRDLDNSLTSSEVIQALERFDRSPATPRAVV